jgi:hypothetical protein
MEIGLYTFGDAGPDPATGRRISPSERLRNLVEVTDKILAAHEIFQFDRTLIQMAIGVLDHAKLMKAIETLGTKVAPDVREALG